MKKLIALLLALLMVFSMVACGQKEEAPKAEEETKTEAPKEEAKEEEKKEEAPAEEEAAPEKNMSLNILWAGTGNGEMANQAVEMLKEEYGVEVALEYNTVAHEVFQPMLVAGNPPDIVMVQDNFFDHFAAAAEGAYVDITPYLDLPVMGSDKTIKEVGNGDILDAIAMDGAVYLATASLGTENICYNKALCEEHGWEVPETIDEFMALCETIKTTTDIAPFCWTGMYPYYASPFVFPLICTYGEGAAEYKKLNGMEEGFWVSEPVQKTAALLQEMRDKEYFVNGMMSLNHTGSQMEFINGNIAMICVGSWLEAEMDGNWPEGFELSVMHAPTLEAGGEKFVCTSAQKFCFPVAAQNQDWIGEFMQAYYSEESAAYNASNGCTISPYYVANSEAVQANMTDFTIAAIGAADEGTMLYPLAKGWYKEWWDFYQNTLTALVSGEIDAAEFCQMMEDATADVRNDDSITKYAVG